jgi:hypothetical protein
MKNKKRIDSRVWKMIILLIALMLLFAVFNATLMYIFDNGTKRICIQSGNTYLNVQVEGNTYEYCGDLNKIIESISKLYNNINQQYNESISYLNNYNITYIGDKR